MTDVPLYVAGQRLDRGTRRDVRSPYDGRRVGSVALAGVEDAEAAVRAAIEWPGRARPTRHQRSTVLRRAEELLSARADEFSSLISAESGLCVAETRYEVSRALDVLRFAAMVALDDDGEAFAGDISAIGKARRTITHREPLSVAVAITPFNHPLNTVAHKLAPAIAAGTPVVLKPSEKTPLTAVKLAELLYEAGLPGPMLSVILGETSDVSSALVRHPAVEAVTFTGSTHVGRLIAGTAGYKRLALELGGNSELIVLEDADLPLAVRAACEGAFRNSGQRCTAAKRILVHQAIAPEFTRAVVALAGEYTSGDPADPATRVGTVIDEAAAADLHRMIHDAVKDGARLLLGGTRRGALLAPTVLGDVPRSSEVVRREAFGPIAKIIPFRDLDDAIAAANDTEYGLSTGVFTSSMPVAFRVAREVRTGGVNINEVPGYRSELAPFGGVKSSGLGVKEGVREAARWYTNVKTVSFPW